MELSKLGLNAAQEAAFEKYTRLLLEANKKMNLTAITDIGEINLKHFWDSLSIFGAECLQKEGLSVLDLGSGAGFPGVPVAIVRPDLKITLMDSLNKRVAFLEEVCGELELKNVRCVCARAEDLARDEAFRAEFDICTARAVATLRLLLEYALPFLKEGGYLVAMKGAHDAVRSEISEAKNALEILGGELIGVLETALPEDGAERCIVVVQKVRTTPDKYPRRAGIPAKRPL